MFYDYLERGRPPKMPSDVHIEQDYSGGLDSPPKAKRKSRPPRRHKPDYDPRTDGLSLEGMDGASTSMAGSDIAGGKQL